MATTKPATIKQSKTAKVSKVKKIIKSNDCGQQSLDELKALVNPLREEINNLKRNTLIGDVQNVHAYGLKRRQLARILTAINHKASQKEEK